MIGILWHFRNLLDTFHLEQLPDDLFRTLWGIVSASSPLLHLLGGMIFHDRTGLVDSTLRAAVAVPLPLPLLVYSFSRASAIRSLDLSKTKVGDSLFATLAASGLASCLLRLRLSGSFVSDASASKWNSFSSLEDLDISRCRYIGMESQKVIGNSLPLISWKLDTHRQAWPDGNVLNLPAGLQVLSFAGPTPCLSHLSPCPQLSNIDCDEDHWSTVENFHDLASLNEVFLKYPKLFYFAIPLNFEEFYPVSLAALQNLRRMSLAMGRLSLATEHAVALARACPNLVSLAMEVYLIPPDVSLWALSSVEELKITGTAAFDRIKAWPCNLTRLEALSPIPSHTVPREWFTFLAYSSPSLRLLHIGHTFHFSISDVEYVLDTFSKLEDLKMSAPFGAGQTNPRRHLPNMALCSADWFASAYSPSLRELSVMYAASARLLSPSAAPSLVRLDLGTTSNVSNNPLIRDTFVAVSFLTSLRRLKLYEPISSLNLRQIVCLSALSHVSIYADTPKVGQLQIDDLQFILARLKRLVVFKFQAPRGCDMSVLASDSVRKISVAVPEGNCLRITDQFPALSELQILPEMEGNPGVFISGARHLCWVEFQGTSRLPRQHYVDASVENCPELEFMHFRDGDIKLTLVNLPKLSILKRGFGVSLVHVVAESVPKIVQELEKWKRRG